MLMCKIFRLNKQKNLNYLKCQFFRKEDEVVYQGCQLLSNDTNFLNNSAITRQEFKENGYNHLAKFYLI